MKVEILKPYYEHNGITICAIEDPKHNFALKKIDTLIDKFGMLGTVDMDDIIPLLYRRKELSL